MNGEVEEFIKSLSEINKRMNLSFEKKRGIDQECKKVIMRDPKSLNFTHRLIS